jgi:hypothetical protein
VVQGALGGDGPSNSQDLLVPAAQGAPLNTRCHDVEENGSLHALPHVMAVPIKISATPLLPLPICNQSLAPPIPTDWSDSHDNRSVSAIGGLPVKKKQCIMGTVTG